MSGLDKINSKQYLEDVIVQILANCPEEYLLDDEKYCSEVAKIAEEYNKIEVEIASEKNTLKISPEDSEQDRENKRNKLNALKIKQSNIDQKKVVRHFDLYFESLYNYVTDINAAQMRLFVAAVRFSRHFPRPFTAQIKSTFNMCMDGFQAFVHAKYFTFHSPRHLLTMSFADESVREHHIEQNQKAFARFKLGDWPKPESPYYTKLHPFLHRLNNTNNVSVGRQVVQLKSFTLGVLLAPEFVDILNWLDDNSSNKQLEKDCPELRNTENKFNQLTQASIDNNFIDPEDDLSSIVQQLVGIGLDQSASAQLITKAASQDDKQIYRRILENIIEHAGKTVVKMKRLNVREYNTFSMELISGEKPLSSSKKGRSSGGGVGSSSSSAAVVVSSGIRKSKSGVLKG